MSPQVLGLSEMDGISPVQREREDLALHVDLCGQRHVMLHTKLDEIGRDMDARFGRIEKAALGALGLLLPVAVTKIPELLDLWAKLRGH